MTSSGTSTSSGSGTDPGSDPGSDPGEPDVAVLALGNILAGDDGAGPAALAELLRTHDLPPGVRALDGGVLGMNLLGVLAGTRALLVLDAVDSGQAPGELIRLEGERLRAAFAARLSAHELGFAEVLSAARLRGTQPARLVLWGIQPWEVGMTVGLTAPVAAGIPGLALAAAGELRSWGLAPSERCPPGPTLPYPGDVIAPLLVH